MHLNHINLVVPDVAETRAFLETHFGLRCTVEKGADTLVGLRDETGLSLVLTNFDHVDAVQYPSMFHIGFRLDSDEAVDAVHRRVEQAGVPVEAPKTFHGAWVFYVTAPGGFTIEVGHQRTDDPSPAGQSEP